MIDELRPTIKLCSDQKQTFEESLFDTSPQSGKYDDEKNQKFSGKHFMQTVQDSGANLLH
ncbi:hypothetical protein [Desulfocicer niacini]